MSEIKDVKKLAYEQAMKETLWYKEICLKEARADIEEMIKQDTNNDN